MNMTKAVSIQVLGALVGLLFTTSTHAQGPEVLRIGVLTDMSSQFSAVSGKGSVVATKLAAEEFGNTVIGKRIEVISADNQVRADVGSAIARRWYDVEGVDAIVDVAVSSVAFAVLEIARERNKMMLVSTAGSSDLTDKQCAPTSMHWTYDTYATAATAAAASKPGQKWFFITSDYAFGHALERDTTNFVNKFGGSVVGGVRVPLNNSDYSSFLVQAQRSGADILALATGTTDTQNALKQATEFGIVPKMKPIALQSTLPDVKAIGLPIAKGLIEVTAFYWDRTPATREWSKKFFDQTGVMPTMMHAGLYSAVRHYLAAVKAAGTTDALKVALKMKETPVNDMFAENGQLRADGRMVHDMYVLQVKTPAESKGPWDLYHLVSTIPGDKVYRPLKDSLCPLVAK
jgi:branched-chain amino acid transport system substrate-binding protein